VLALRAATLEAPLKVLGRFAAIPDVARMPAEVFLDVPQAVIDLANEDANQVTPES
jgi:hypothetical protein